MREIGGYLEFELKFTGKEYHENAIKLNFARNAILYLVKAKKYRKIYLPYLLCACISDIMKKNNIEIEHYHVDKRFRPIFYGLVKPGEAMLIVNYYGQLSDDEIISYKKTWNYIIVDNSQDFFRLPIKGIDTIYNARKYFGITDGAYLYTDSPLNQELKNEYSFDKLKHLVGRLEKGGGDFYENFLLFEESLNQEELKNMSVFSNNILKGVNYNQVYQTRVENCACLNQRLSSMNEYKFLADKTTTYMYPFWCEKGKEMRSQLIKHKIYIPVLWPNVLNEQREDTDEYQMVANILPIPIDQRYTSKDMEYICNRIVELLNE